MSNSPLICYTKLSPNCSKPRNHAIDTITIHCMAGNCSIETCGEIFTPSSRQASSNYGIGSDGRIALYVDEANRSWCSSSASNDNRAVTIEVANTVAADPWPVSDKAYAALLDLVTDICKRNGIKKLLWQGDKSLIGQIAKQNMTVHRWFAAKSCPGDYLYSRHAAIAAEVNKRLGATTTSSTTSTSSNTAATSGSSYSVRISTSGLRIRKGPGTNYGIAQNAIAPGVYTIVAESSGAGSTKGWGKLKSGAGWISLDYAAKV